MARSIWNRFFSSRGVKGVFACVLFVFGNSAFAWGFGEMRVASSLGQPFRVQIDLFGSDVASAEKSCFKAQLLAFDGAPLGTASVTFRENTHTLVVSTRTPINEPAANLTVSHTCNPRMQREYAILLDLPTDRSAAAQLQAPPPLERVRPVAPTMTPGVNDEGAPPPVRKQPRSETRRSSQQSASSSSNNEIVESKPRPTPERETRKKQTVKKTEEASKSVLKLGHEGEQDGSGTIFRQRLALSYTLSSPPPTEAIASPEPAADAGSASGETLPVADAALQQLLEKIRALEARTAALQKQNAQQLTALDQAKKAQDSSSGSLYLLYFLLLVCALAIGWLIWRMRQVRSEVEYSSWQQIVPDDEEPQVAESASQAAIVDVPVSFNNGAVQPDVAKVAPVALAPEKDDVVVQTPSVSMPFGRRKKKVAETAVPRTLAVKREESVDQDDNGSRMTVANAEEILDEIQEAEFWVHMNQPERAIAILESDDLRPNSPLKWLHLFDLYRIVGDQEKYELLATRFKQVFNGRITPWGEPEGTAGERYIEDFPLVMEQIITAWPTAQVVPFMESLLIDDRDGNRQGFDLLAYRDLLFLTNIAYQVQSLREVDGVSEEPAFLLPEGESMFSSHQNEVEEPKNIPPLEWPGSKP